MNNSILHDLKTLIPTPRFSTLEIAPLYLFHFRIPSGGKKTLTILILTNNAS